MVDIQIHNNIDSDNSIKLTRKRPNKKIVFEKEQHQILEKLNTILGITDSNNFFSLYELENDENKHREIVNLEIDLKKYFACSQWAYFNGKNVKKEYMSLVRSIYKKMGYDVVGKSTKIKINPDKVIHSKIYYIIKKNV
jgi:hypothetical protein